MIKSPSIFALSLLLGTMLLSPAGSAETTKSCPSGQADMLDWMTLDSDLRPSKHMERPNHPLFTVVEPDKFYWLKNPAGDTWDIWLYNDSMIYLWITERVWNQPYDYKKSYSNFNFPATPRCATVGLPGTQVLVSNTDYTIAKSCQEGSPLNLGKALFSAWGPFTAGQPGLETWRPRIGGGIPDSTPIIVLSYRWSCNSFYGNCLAKEEFMLAQRYGLVRHTRFDLVSGEYQLQARQTFSQVLNGTATPFFPCF